MVDQNVILVLQTMDLGSWMGTTKLKLGNASDSDTHNTTQHTKKASVVWDIWTSEE